MSKAGARVDRARKDEKKEAALERDAALVAINTKYDEQIDKLRTAAHEERNKVWKAWRERRSES